MKLLRMTAFLISLLLFLTCIPTLLFARAEEMIEEVYPLERGGNVFLKNISGNIVVNSWEKDEIKITARKVARKKAHLDRMEIDIDHSEGHISIITRHRKSFSLFPFINFSSDTGSVHYELLIPDRAGIKIESVSGRAEASAIGGYLQINTVSGDIRAVTALNGVRCKSVSGGIYLQGITGNADLESTSGKISVEEIMGSINAKTVSGDIDLDNFSSADEIDANSISGSVKLRGQLSPEGLYELDTISGGIRISVPSDSEFEIQSSSVSGDIYCDFNILVSGKIERNKLRGIVGNGGPRLFIKSVSGSVRIMKRD
jgi:DUF4097 and DUF4098 domain-containing protein YvlB